MSPLNPNVSKAFKSHFQVQDGPKHQRDPTFGPFPEFCKEIRFLAVFVQVWWPFRNKSTGREWFGIPVTLFLSFFLLFGSKYGYI